MIVVVVVVVVIMITIMIIIMVLYGAFRYFSTSPHCDRELSPTRTLQWPGRNCVQITCNALTAYDVQHSMFPLAQRDSSAIKCDR